MFKKLVEEDFRYLNFWFYVLSLNLKFNIEIWWCSIELIFKVYYWSWTGVVPGFFDGGGRSWKIVRKSWKIGKKSSAAKGRVYLFLVFLPSFQVFFQVFQDLPPPPKIQFWTESTLLVCRCVDGDFGKSSAGEGCSKFF